MITEINEVKKYLLDKFGSTEKIEDGIYAIPTQTSKGKAFMKFEYPKGNDNFMLYWDKELTISWYDNDKPQTTK